MANGRAVLVRLLIPLLIPPGAAMGTWITPPLSHRRHGVVHHARVRTLHPQLHLVATQVPYPYSYYFYCAHGPITSTHIMYPYYYRYPPPTHSQPQCGARVHAEAPRHRFDDLPLPPPLERKRAVTNTGAAAGHEQHHVQDAGTDSISGRFHKRGVDDRCTRLLSSRSVAESGATLTLKSEISCVKLSNDNGNDQ